MGGAAQLKVLGKGDMVGASAAGTSTVLGLHVSAGFDRNGFCVELAQCRTPGSAAAVAQGSKGSTGRVTSSCAAEPQLGCFSSRSPQSDLCEKSCQVFHSQEIRSFSLGKAHFPTAQPMPLPRQRGQKAEYFKCPPEKQLLNAQWRNVRSEPVGEGLLWPLSM